MFQVCHRTHIRSYQSDLEIGRGAMCRGGKQNSSQPVTKDGFWASFDTNQTLRGFPFVMPNNTYPLEVSAAALEQARKDLPAIFFKCSIEHACKADNLCHPDHRGPLCGLCQPGLGMDSSSTCIECGEEKVAVIRAVSGTIFLALFCAAYYRFCLRDLFSEHSEPLSENSQDNSDQQTGICSRSGAALATSASRCLMKFRAAQLCVHSFNYVARKFTGFIIVLLSGFLRNSGSEVIKVLISFAQVSGTFATQYSVQWPPALANFLNALTFFNATLRALPGNLACAMTGISFRQLQYGYLLAPIALFVIMGLPAAYVSLCRHHPKYEQIMKRLASNGCFALFFLYPIVSGPALDNQMCVEIGGGDTRLKAFLEEPCYSQDASSSEFAIGIALVVMYPIGGLVILAFLLWYYDIHKMARHKIEEAHLHSLLAFYKRVSSKTIAAKIAHEVGGAASLLEPSTSAPTGIRLNTQSQLIAYGSILHEHGGRSRKGCREPYVFVRCPTTVNV